MPSAIRSLRILRKHWKLAAIAVFSLSIAMALGVITLSISNTFLLLPPAAAEPDRLVTIYTRADSSAIEMVSWPDLQYYRQNNNVFTDIAAAPNSISLSAEQDAGKPAVQLVSRPVSENYFAVMGIRPWLGRLFAKGDDDGDTNIAVMTWSCWNRLGSDHKIVGKKLAGHTIVGVTPKEFTGSFYGLNGDLLVPMGQEYTSARNNPRDARRLFLTARLKPGVTRQQAQAEMRHLSAQLAAAYPKEEDPKRTAMVARATLLPTDGVNDVAIAAGVLLGVVLLVLLIACANVANLLLAVAVGRRQEASIKLALGAQRGRLIREFLKESAVICIASGLIGYAVAATLIARYSNYTFTLPIYGAFSPGLNLHLDFAVAAFTAALVLIAILATGLSPALYASAPAVSQVLNGETVVGGTRKNARRSALVIVQVAVCTLVLIGMGLCWRSLYNLRHVDPGFAVRNLVGVEIFPRGEVYTPVRGRELYDTLRTRAAALPGVESVGMTSDLPLLGSKEEQVKFPDTGKETQVNHIIVDAGYFGTLGIRVLAGRTFNSGDREGSLPVVVVNRKLADTFWPGRDAVGQVVNLARSARKLTVVGVVADGKYDDLDEAPQPFMYYDLTQDYQESMYLVAGTKGDPHSLIEPLSKSLRSLDAPWYFAPTTFDTWMNFTLLGERIITGCAAALSGLGLLLSIIGLYGAISYSVSERKKELGIRVALGARRSQLLKMIFRQTLRVTGTGVLIGVILGIAGTMLAQSQFYGIAAVEWTVLLSVAAAMLGISVLVAWVSARTWVRVNPMEAVRHA